MVSRLQFCVVFTADSNVDDDDNDVSEDLKLDYFYQNDTEAAALRASVSKPRFHRSAVALPVTPSAVADDDRRSRFNRKIKLRKHAPPSYAEAFVRPGQGFITARRDKELYTRSAGYLDEL